MRRSRRRFWKSEADADKIAAYLTLYECLVTVAKLLAPFTPFLAEELYQNLVAERSPGAPESVHLVDWPVADEALIDHDLSFRMGAARQVVNLGRAARNASQIKTRQPVAVAVVACRPKERAAVESLAGVVAEELNVKRIDFVESASELVSYVVKPNYRTLGPKFGKNMPAVAAAVAALPADEVGDRLAAGRSVMVLVPSAIEVGPGELDGLMAPAFREYEFASDDFVVETHEREGFKVEREGGIAVAISTRPVAGIAERGPGPRTGPPDPEHPQGRRLPDRRPHPPARCRPGRDRRDAGRAWRLGEEGDAGGGPGSEQDPRRRPSWDRRCRGRRGCRGRGWRGVGRPRCRAHLCARDLSRGAQGQRAAGDRGAVEGLMLGAIREAARVTPTIGKLLGDF